MTVRQFLIGAIGLTVALTTTGLAEALTEPTSLPTILVSVFEDEPVAIEMSASAEQLSNVPEPAIDSTAIIRLLQKAVDQLSAAELKEEADQAAQLLKKFEQKHPIRSSLDVSDADLVKLRSDLSWVRDRLSLFYIDIELDRRVLRAGEMTVTLGSCPKAVHEYLCDDDGRDCIGSPHARCFLPEELRVALEDEPGVSEEPASADEPSNLRGLFVHPTAILQSLQESIERLSAAGLAAEAEGATHLLNKFQQKHQLRMLIEIQHADLTKHRSNLDRLLRRLGRFDIDPARGDRAARVPELRAEEVKFPVVSDERNLDYGRCLIDTRPRPLGSFSYTMSPVWLKQ